MKMDKETLVKHQFWLLLGLSGVLILAALVLLFLGPAAKARKERTEFLKEKDKFNPSKNAAIKDPKNGSFLTAWNTRRDFFAGHKSTVWGEAWKAQNERDGAKDPFMTWPRGLAYMEKAHFGDDIKAAERLDYRNKHYEEQFTPEAFFRPSVNESGVYFPVTFDKDKIFDRHKWTTTPEVEECWLAQEDIWVRREILKVLQKALRAMGHCKPVREPLWHDSVTAAAGVAVNALVLHDPQAKVYKEFTDVRLEAKENSQGVLLPVPVKKDLKDDLKGIKKSLLFRSHNWEVNILLEAKPNSVDEWQVSGRSTIKNINPAGRALSLTNNGLPRRLRFRQGRGPGSPYELEGELLRWNQSVEFKKPHEGSINWKENFDVEEEFDLPTSPIKALETLKVGHEAIYNRFTAANFELQKGRLTPKPKDPENTENQGGNTGNTGSPMGQGPMGMSPPGMGGPGQQKGGAAKDDLTPNGIDRLRYVLKPDIEPVRRIPVAFTIVVDQAYRNEVLAAVANSRLRIQTTWVYWAHRDYKPLTGSGVVSGYGPPDRRGMMQPPMMGRPNGGGSGRPGPMGAPPMPGLPKGGSGGVSPPPMPMGGGPPRPMGGGPAGGGPAQPADNAAVGDHNLIELSVHGIAALFERYPQKKKPTEGETSTK